MNVCSIQSVNSTRIWLFKCVPSYNINWEKMDTSNYMCYLIYCALNHTNFHGIINDRKMFANWYDKVNSMTEVFGLFDKNRDISHTQAHTHWRVTYARMHILQAYAHATNILDVKIECIRWNVKQLKTKPQNRNDSHTYICECVFVNTKISMQEMCIKLIAVQFVGAYGTCQP